MFRSPSLPRATLRSGADLAAAGLVKADRVAGIDAVAARYRMAVTPALAELIDPDDPADPIARQFIPDPRELETSPEERPDPIGDESHSPVKGVIHRYPDRVLLTPLLHCPFLCRFCFRRGRVGGDGGVLTPAETEAALDYIRDHREVWEVVLSGGDPLMLSPARLGALLAALDAIDHVAVVRIHTRVPVGVPDRVDQRMIDAFSRVSRAALWLALHCNHPRELSPRTRAVCRALSRAGIPLLGQTVLLRGVNDDPGVMEALFRAMVGNRIKPYYLHHPDLAMGTAHFRCGIEEGQEIMRRLRGRLSGLCQPTYVLDIPDGHGKVPVGPGYMQGGEVADWNGVRHRYP